MPCNRDFRRPLRCGCLSASFASIQQTSSGVARLTASCSSAGRVRSPNCPRPPSVTVRPVKKPASVVSQRETGVRGGISQCCQLASRLRATGQGVTVTEQIQGTFMSAEATRFPHSHRREAESCHQSVSDESRLATIVGTARRAEAGLLGLERLPVTPFKKRDRDGLP